MIKKIVLTVIILCCFVGAVSIPKIVSAQSETASDEAVPSEQPITPELTKERETQRIAELRILYRDQVGVYRTAERAFIIAKTNYFQVQTLSALEEAVRATQTVLMERSKVLVTYLELVDAVLIETNGVELDLKNQSHTELFNVINALKIHQETIAVSKDRQAMAIVADEFEPIAVSYQSAVYKALSLIRIGKIQEIHDKAEIIEADIIKEHESQEVSSVVTARRERAYAEIERNFEETNTNLVKLNAQFLDAKQKGFTRSFFERILESLSPVYVQITRSLDHLEELVTL